MIEPFENIHPICEDCAPRPNPDLHRFEPEKYIGKHVKLAFTEIDSERVEHLWVKVSREDKPGWLIGALANDPIYDVGGTCGDEVLFKIDEIEQMEM